MKCFSCENDVRESMAFHVSITSPCYDNGYGRKQIQFTLCPMCVGYSSRDYQGTHESWPRELPGEKLAGALGEFSSWGNPECNLSEVCANAGYDDDNCSQAFGEKHRAKPVVRVVRL